MRFFSVFFRLCGFLVAGLFIAAIALAQYSCPIPACTGQAIDAWLGAAALAPFGIPALIFSVISLRAFRKR